MPACWDDLPRELQRRIRWLAAAESRAVVQDAWRCYRAYVLVHRFGMLLRVHEFRKWNPTPRPFLAENMNPTLSQPPKVFSSA